MKWIIYVLLLVNLGLFVWHYQPEDGAHHKSTREQSTRLVLLSEYEQQLQLTGDGKDSASCYNLGPFTHRDSFRKAKQRFIKQGITVFERVSSDSVRNGYWVLLPASNSRNLARVQIQQLKEKGVKEYFLIDTGEMKNAISLGVFSKPNLAKRRHDKVEKLGFRPIIRKIALPKRVYWLEWSRQSARQPDKQMLEELAEQFEGVGQTERPCLGREKG